MLVVDDRVERTAPAAEAAATAATGDRTVSRWLRGEPLPDGWVGKSWACWQGARQRAGEWLLFSDADVVHAPEALVALPGARASASDRGGLTL